MSLARVRFAGASTEPSSCDHIRAHMPNAWQRDLTFGARPARKQLVIGSYSYLEDWH
jgi:hypothetical protein